MNELIDSIFSFEKRRASLPGTGSSASSYHSQNRERNFARDEAPKL
jgi:hypothetical protein